MTAERLATNATAAELSPLTTLHFFFFYGHSYTVLANTSLSRYWFNGRCCSSSQEFHSCVFVFLQRDPSFCTAQSLKGKKKVRYTLASRPVCRSRHGFCMHSVAMTTDILFGTIAFPTVALSMGCVLAGHSRAVRWSILSRYYFTCGKPSSSMTVGIFDMRLACGP